MKNRIVGRMIAAVLAGVLVITSAPVGVNAAAIEDIILSENTEGITGDDELTETEDTIVGDDLNKTERITGGNKLTETEDITEDNEVTVKEKDLLDAGLYLDDIGTDDIAAIDDTGADDFEPGEMQEADPIEVENPSFMGYSYSSDQASSLPSQYIPTDLPSLRSQGSNSTCWAFSSIALAEMSLIKKGKASSSTVDLSELQLSYFTYNTVNDPLGGLYGDDNRVKGSGYNFLNRGGNRNFSKNILASWTGAALESKVPYSNATNVKNNGLNSAYAYDDEAHLVNYYDVQVSTKTYDSAKGYIKVFHEDGIEAAKRLVYEYGAAGISYKSESGTSAVAGSLYNSTYNSYYDPSVRDTNHAVTIVGWDDNFSRNNFAGSTKPQGDGAWLIRNSWTDGGNYENNKKYAGYFWLSYYSNSNGDTVNAFVFDKANNYDNNYQYDGSMDSVTYGGNSDTITAANVFTANACTGGETLKAVSFATPSADVDYEIDIYRNISGSTGSPANGTKVTAAHTTGRTLYAGYHTIPLVSEVELGYNEKYAVAVKLKKSGDAPKIYRERTVSTADWYSTTAYITSGQSFWFNGVTWQDASALYSDSCGNFRIKAFTDSMPAQVIPAPSNIRYNGGAWKEFWNGDVVISAPGYQVSDSRTGSFADSYTITGSGGITKTLYFRDDAKTGVTNGVNITVNIDRIAPTGTISLGSKSWNRLNGSVSFTRYWLSDKSVSITPNDELSGIGSVQYCIKTGDTQYTSVSTLSSALLSWQNYNSSSKPTISVNTKTVVYARITDVAGNTTYLSSEGVLIDETVPVLSNTGIISTETGSDSVSVQYKVSEVSDVYFVVVPAGNTSSPSAADIIKTADSTAVGAAGGSVISAKVSTGKDEVAADETGNIHVKHINGLQPNTAYKVWMAAADKPFSRIDTGTSVTVVNKSTAVNAGTFTTERTNVVGSVIFDDDSPSYGTQITAIANVTTSDPGTATYAWYRISGTSQMLISGAVTASYTPVKEDIGRKLRVKISYSNCGSYLSADTGVVIKGASPAVNKPINITINNERGIDTFAFDGVKDVIYEYSLNGGNDWQELTASSTGTGYTVSGSVLKGIIVVGNVNIPAGELKIRAKETEVYFAGEASVNEEAFTAFLEGTVTLKGDCRVGSILTASVSGEQSDAGLTYAWYRVKDGAETLITESGGRIYTVDMNSAGCYIRVKVSASGYEGALLADSAVTVTVDDESVESMIIEFADGVRGERFREYTYTGSAIKPLMRVYYRGSLLTEGTDYTVGYKNNIKAYEPASDWPIGSKDPQVTIKFKGDYNGTRILNFKINKINYADLYAEKKITAEPVSALVKKNSKGIYSVQKLKPVIYYEGKQLKLNTDYTLHYDDTREGAYAKPTSDDGAWKITVKAKGDNFTGSFDIDEILKENSKTRSYIALNNGAIKVALTTSKVGYLDKLPGYSLTYTDSKTKVVTRLLEGTDYTVDVVGAGKKGTASYIFTAAPDSERYVGSVKKNFSITAADLRMQNNLNISVENSGQVAYEKDGVKPAVTVMLGTDTLTEGIDYKLSYGRNKATGDSSDKNAPYVKIAGIGNYKGSVVKPFTIKQSDISLLTEPMVSNVVYSKSRNAYQKTKIILKDSNGKVLKQGSDFKITGFKTENDSEIPAAGTTVKAVIEGNKNYTGTRNIEYKVLSGDINKMKALLYLDAQKRNQTSTFDYTGEEIKPYCNLWVKRGRYYEPLREKTSDSMEGDFEIAGYYNNVNKGTGYIVIKGTGSYAGFKIVKFKINARKVKVN